MESNPLKILLTFDRWATHRIFDTCAALSDHLLDTEFDIGIGSLRKTLAHVAAGMDWWLDQYHQGTIRPYDPRVESLENIRARFEIAWDSMETILNVSTPDQLSEVIVDSFDNPEFGKGTLRFRRSAVLLHLFNHGTHHRVQCLNMLRHLGVDPLPEIDLIDSHQELET